MKMPLLILDVDETLIDMLFKGGGFPVEALGDFDVHDNQYFILKNKEEVRKIEISNVKCVEDTFGKIVIMGFHYKKYILAAIQRKWL